MGVALQLLLAASCIGFSVAYGRHGGNMQSVIFLCTAMLILAISIQGQQL